MSIEIMKKICLSLSAGSEKEMHNLAESKDFKFIFGVASDGLTPFEASLLGKKKGWNSVVEVSSSEVAEFFGYLKLQLQQNMGIKSFPHTFFLNINVKDVIEAENMEIVQAIARATSQGGCGGSCNCGCS